MFYVYLIYNNVNGKLYVGKTKNFKTRLSTHIRIAYGSDESYNKYPIHHAIKKYGKENFIFKIVGEYQTEQEAFASEIEWIALLSDLGYVLYNLTKGGDGIALLIFSDEHRKNLSLSHIGQIPWNKGLQTPELVKQKLRDSHKGQKAWNKNILMSNDLKMKISGHRHPQSSLTEQQIVEIRNLFNVLKLQEIADRYNVSLTTIKRIKYGQTYCFT